MGWGGVGRGEVGWGGLGWAGLVWAGLGWAGVGFLLAQDPGVTSQGGRGSRGRGLFTNGFLLLEAVPLRSQGPALVDSRHSTQHLATTAMRNP